MDIKWKYVKPLADKTVVRDFLARNNIILPQKTISTIECYNGGRPMPNDIITDTKKEHVFKSLLSYNEYDKENIYNVFPDSDLFRGRTLFPIATDPAGNYVCYDTIAKKYVFYDHETKQKEIIVEMALL